VNLLDLIGARRGGKAAGAYSCCRVFLTLIPEYVPAPNFTLDFDHHRKYPVNMSGKSTQCILTSPAVP